MLKKGLIAGVIGFALLGMWQHESEARTTRTLGWTIKWHRGIATARHRQMKQRLVIYRNQRERVCRTAKYCGTRHMLLSIVGSVVSYRTDWYSEKGGTPSYGTKYTAVDLDQVDKRITLDWLFSKEDVFKELMKQGIIRKSLRGKRPQNLDQLFKYIHKSCRLDVSERLLGQFAFYDLDRDQAKIRIGLSHGCESHRGSFAELSLSLKGQSRLLRDMRLAKRQRLLMKHLSATR